MKTKLKEILGMFAKSNAGHDTNAIYIITKILDDGYVLVCDGNYKKLEKPKKKRIKHLELFNFIAEPIKEKLEKNIKIYDAEIYSKIKQFKERGQK